MFVYADAVHVDDIQVLGCGTLSWKPPRGNEGDPLGYVVRFYDEESAVNTNRGYRSVQRYFEDIGRQWAVADNLPTDGRIVYADVSIIYKFSVLKSCNVLFTLGTSNEQFRSYQ